MSTPPPNPPADAFAAFVRWLSHAVITRGLMGLLAAPVVNHLIDHLRVAKQRLTRLAGRVAAGTFAPRRVAARQTGDNPKPRPDIPRRQKFGWLRPLLPDAVPAAGHLEHLLHDPDMVALMRAAPAEVARIVRPLCWMLRIKPPPILASPRRKARPPEAGPTPDPAQNPAAPPIPPGSPPPRPPTRTPRARLSKARRAPPPAVHTGPPRPA